MISKVDYIINEKKICLLKGDITGIAVDAIVNAANSKLLSGGGVCGAIHRAGGPAISQDCMKYSGCPTGEAVITTAGNLPAKYVIHAVGPVWQGGENREPFLLRNAYYNSLLIAAEKKLKSIAFPSISTGIYGFPIDYASDIALTTIITFTIHHEYPGEIYCVLFSDSDYDLYKKNMENILKNE